MIRRPRSRQRWQPGHAAALASLVLAVLALVPAARWLGSLRYNSSGSLPRGLYRLAALPRSGAGSLPPRFSLVLVCPPRAAGPLALARRYLARGDCPSGTHPLGKLLAAGPGDPIDFSPAGLLVGGRSLPGSRPRAADAAGRPLAHAPFGRFRLGADQLWLYSPHPRSFDSRCFGPVSASDLRGLLVPVWIISTTASDRAVLALSAGAGTQGRI